MNPFTDQSELQVLQLGERELINRISFWLGDVSPPSPGGIGDDAAELETPHGKQIATKDALVYSKHFDEQAHPSLVGAKLLKRNLSDLAAMGASPRNALLACLLPPTTSTHWLEGFFDGLQQCANEYGVHIVGGDISSSVHDLALTLTLLGDAAENPLTRKSAGLGDTLWVTGELGGSILGKHLSFTPRLAEGAWLAHSTSVTSGMDLSDGLATDLIHLCPETYQLELDTDALPISQAAQTLSEQTSKNPVWHALTDGEDYELLFTVRADMNPVEFIKEWASHFETKLTCIGKVIARTAPEDSAIQYHGSYRPTTEESGYEHFR